MSAGLASLFVGSALFITLGLTIMQTYHAESSFKSTNCSVRAVEQHKMNSKVDWYRCPWRCTITYAPDGLKTFCELSEFPCLRIVVDVATRYGLKTAILHETPDKMSRYSDCSTFYCDRDSVVNEKLVAKFKRNYGQVGKQLNCYFNLNSLQSDDYDDDGQEHALLDLTYSQAAYVNSLLWPIVLLVVGVALVAYALFLQHKEKKDASIERKRAIDKLQL